MENNNSFRVPTVAVFERAPTKCAPVGGRHSDGPSRIGTTVPPSGPICNATHSPSAPPPPPLSNQSAPVSSVTLRTCVSASIPPDAAAAPPVVPSNHVCSTTLPNPPPPPVIVMTAATDSSSRSSQSFDSSSSNKEDTSLHVTNCCPSLKAAPSLDCGYDVEDDDPSSRCSPLSPRSTHSTESSCSTVGLVASGSDDDDDDGDDQTAANHHPPPPPDRFRQRSVTSTAAKHTTPPPSATMRRPIKRSRSWWNWGRTRKSKVKRVRTAVSSYCGGSANLGVETMVSWSDALFGRCAERQTRSDLCRRYCRTDIPPLNCAQHDGGYSLLDILGGNHISRSPTHTIDGLRV